jgi:alkylhydroperoxidase family enzyme
VTVEAPPNAAPVVTRGGVMARINVPDGDRPEISRVWGLRPELGAAVTALSTAVYQKSELHPRVREVVRMRIAQINDCPI